MVAPEREAAPHSPPTARRDGTTDGDGRRRAVIIGGSFAGLCAARALADHFERVTILDRAREQAFDPDDDARPAPSATEALLPLQSLQPLLHPHILLARGRRELEWLFPGIGARLLARGAVLLDSTRDVIKAGRGESESSSPDASHGARVPEPSGISGLCASQGLFLAALRDELRRLPNVELVSGAIAGGLRGEGRGALRVTGVEFHSDGAPGECVIGADLVVDASGRSTKANDWLRRMGITEPKETRTNGDAAYAWRCYESAPPEQRPAWRALLVDPLAVAEPGPSREPTATTPESLTRGSLLPVEGNRFVATLSGPGRHLPTRTEAAFQESADALQSPLLGRALRLARPLSRIHSGRASSNRLRHYDRWSGPAGFVAVGDAVCALNHVYAQGLTCAAVSARILAEELDRPRRRSSHFARHFHRRQAGFLRQVWRLAVTADLHRSSTKGRQRLGTRLLLTYWRALARAARRDPELRRVVAHVEHLLAPPRTLFEASVAIRTLRHALRAEGEAPLHESRAPRTGLRPPPLPRMVA